MDGTGDGGVPHGDLLMRFGEAAVDGSPAALIEARSRVRDALGEAGMIDAAGVIGIFDAVVRIADATGIPLESHKAEISADFRRELGIDAFRG